MNTAGRRELAELLPRRLTRVVRGSGVSIHQAEQRELPGPGLQLGPSDQDGQRQWGCPRRAADAQGSREVLSDRSEIAFRQVDEAEVVQGPRLVVRMAELGAHRKAALEQRSRTRVLVSHKG